MIPNILLYILPIAILSLGGLVVMLADAFQQREGGMALPTAMLHLAAGAAAWMLWSRAGDPTVVAEAATTLGGYLVFDRATLFLCIIIALGGGLTALLAGGYLSEHGLERGEFYSLITFASAGSMMLVAANELIMLFVALETMSLGVYAMTGFRRTSARSTEAAVKYFLLGSFAAAILLYGSALLYGITGHTDLAGIRDALNAPLALPAEANEEINKFITDQYDLRTRVGIVGMVLVLVAMAFKVSAVPFHMWTPDAYEGAPTPATAFMSVAVKAAAFGALLRVMLTVWGDPNGAGSGVAGWPAMLGWLAILTMTVANVIATAQQSVKRMLAYSSIAHAGYLMLGVVVAPRTEVLAGSTVTVGQTAIAAVLFYLLGYTVTNIGAFGTLILSGRKNREATSYNDLAGLGKRHPAVALAMTFFILSLTGIPPTVGFFAKFYVIRATLDAGYTWLAIFAMLNSVISAYYYLRVLVKMYMDEPEPGDPKAVPMQSGFVSGTLVVSAVLVLVFGVMPQRFLTMALEAVQQLTTR